MHAATHDNALGAALHFTRCIGMLARERCYSVRTFVDARGYVAWDGHKKAAMGLAARLKYQSSETTQMTNHKHQIHRKRN